MLLMIFLGIQMKDVQYGCIRAYMFIYEEHVIHLDIN